MKRSVVNWISERNDCIERDKRLRNLLIVYSDHPRQVAECMDSESLLVDLLRRMHEVTVKLEAGGETKTTIHKEYRNFVGDESSLFNVSKFPPIGPVPAQLATLLQQKPDYNNIDSVRDYIRQIARALVEYDVRAAPVMWEAQMISRNYGLGPSTSATDNDVEMIETDTYKLNNKELAKEKEKLIVTIETLKKELDKCKKTVSEQNKAKQSLASVQKELELIKTDRDKTKTDLAACKADVDSKNIKITELNNKITDQSAEYALNLEEYKSKLSKKCDEEIAKYRSSFDERQKSISAYTKYSTHVEQVLTNFKEIAKDIDWSKNNDTTFDRLTDLANSEYPEFDKFLRSFIDFLIDAQSEIKRRERSGQDKIDDRYKALEARTKDLEAEIADCTREVELQRTLHTTSMDSYKLELQNYEENKQYLVGQINLLQNTLQKECENTYATLFESNPLYPSIKRALINSLEVVDANVDLINTVSTRGIITEQLIKQVTEQTIAASQDLHRLLDTVRSNYNSIIAEFTDLCVQLLSSFYRLLFFTNMSDKSMYTININDLQNQIPSLTLVTDYSDMKNRILQLFDNITNSMTTQPAQISSPPRTPARSRYVITPSPSPSPPPSPLPPSPPKPSTSTGAATTRTNTPRRVALTTLGPTTKKRGADSPLPEYLMEQSVKKKYTKITAMSSKDYNKLITEYRDFFKYNKSLRKNVVEYDKHARALKIYLESLLTFCSQARTADFPVLISTVANLPRPTMENFETIEPGTKPSIHQIARLRDSYNNTIRTYYKYMNSVQRYTKYIDEVEKYVASIKDSCETPIPDLPALTNIANIEPVEINEEVLESMTDEDEEEYIVKM
ncbi:hypothetical protein SlGVgp041 [Spodoptera litura granulovirus]|uniref:Desmoplakin n=1 Tax=Spodoptera litura granulovirus TaxID=359919 RepID=A5IZP3_9BBAC|nr:hypothetical protein SlGVgp041 [Spodoptera litura granulovirus]ABQ51984.1 hypothetical protein SlGVgp041 [Spodoptera litura granulovirus]